MQRGSGENTVLPPQFFEVRVMVAARHGYEIAGDVRGCPPGVVVTAVLDEGGKLSGAISDGHGLLEGGKPERRKSHDFRVLQAQLVIHIGIPKRPEFINSRNRETCRNRWMIQEHCYQVPTCGPARQDQRPGDAVLAPVLLEPIESSAAFANNFRQ